MSFARCSPLFPVADIRHATDWFGAHLGFEPVFASEAHAFLRRAGAGIRLLRAAPKLDLTRPEAQQSCYIDAEDVDAIYTQHRAALEALPAEQLRAPFDQPYGQREFHVAYKNILIFVGMPVPSEP